jgi:hypothetical protein
VNINQMQQNIDMRNSMKKSTAIDEMTNKEIYFHSLPYTVALTEFDKIR